MGSLYTPTNKHFYTLELPWRDNARGVSSIPDGWYEIERRVSSLTTVQRHGGWTWEVKNVPGRSGILFHAGNTTRDTRGCILIGKTIFNDPSTGTIELRESVDAFKELMLEPYDKGYISITTPYEAIKEEELRETEKERKDKETIKGASGASKKRKSTDKEFK